LKAHKANKNIHRAAALCTFKIVIINSNDIEEAITGPTAVSGSRISLRAPRRRGGGGPPLYIGKQEVGTYIYSLLYTYTGLLG
jgi:hypothetical protein